MQPLTLHLLSLSLSAIHHIHLDYDQQRKIHEFDSAEHACKVVKGELSNTLLKLRQNASSSMSDVQRFGYYHQVLVRARKNCAYLHLLMELTDKQSTIYDSLSHMLADARLVFAELERRADSQKKRKEKKDDVKRFKAYLASILESDDPIGWMASIDEAKLYREGGDSNRLYQLFIEGKGQYTLLIESDMYNAATARDDLFSNKQCKDLAARGEEVAITEAKEAEEAAAAEEKRILEEKEREEAMKKVELRRKWALVGQNTNIVGLTSEKGKHMNMKLARVLYYSVERDRFEVQLYDSEEKAYLKEDNLRVYYGHVPNSQSKQQQRQQQKQQPNQVEVVSPTSLASSVPTSPPKTNPATSGNWQCRKCTYENEEEDTTCSMCTTPQKKEPEQEGWEKLVRPEKVVKKDTFVAEPTKTKPAVQSKANESVDYIAKMKKTIYVKSSHSKKLTGKRGRKKKELVNRSGAQDISIGTSAIGSHVPVHLTGSKAAVWKAIALIQEAIGMENMTEKIPPAQLPNKATKSALAPPPGVVAPTTVKAPTPLTAPSPIAPVPPVDKKSIAPTQEKSPDYVNSGLFSGGFDKPLLNGIKNQNHVSSSGSETQPISYSFGDALLPRGLMDMSLSTPATAVPEEVPSEIGINSSQGMTRETFTEASISSLNDRSNVSKTNSNFTLNEYDPLLVFLRSQHQCIKGSVDEFYIWLVKSEDIDSILALKEAVSDEDYLNDTMKVGNGTSGVKGFKRKAFQRAVSECEDTKPAENTHSHSLSQRERASVTTNASSSMSEMNGSAFLPSNLFNDSPRKSIPGVTANLSDPPAELTCPISLALMTNDPVLAADGITYERAPIEDWFQKSMAKFHNAQENLKKNPFSEPDQRVAKAGICSPVHGTRMNSLALTPNLGVRNMCRTWKERQEAH